MRKSAPHPIDLHVGKRLRSRRTILGMSQEELGETVNVTFQQIQKYERGLNRMGSSRLYEFSCVLNVDVSYFFEDYDVPIPTDSERKPLPEMKDLPIEDIRSSNKEILTLVRAYSGISTPDVRKKVLALIKSISGHQETPEAAEEGITARQIEPAFS